MTEPEPTFSTCFGAPFMPRRPEVYGNLLRDKIAKHGATCWLVNTGWTGGAYGTGSRMPIKATRALLSAALDGSLAEAEFRKDPNFGFDVPVSVPGVADHPAGPAPHLGRRRGLRRAGAKAGGHVRQELRAVRDPHRRGREGRRHRLNAARLRKGFCETTPPR